MLNNHLEFCSYEVVERSFLKHDKLYIRNLNALRKASQVKYARKCLKVKRSTKIQIVILHGNVSKMTNLLNNIS